MILLFEQNTQEFNNRGLGEIDRIISSRVTRVINGQYDLEFYVDIDSKMIKEIKNERVVTVETPNGRQPFIIISVKPEMKSKRVIARHKLLVELTRNFVEDTNIVNQNGVSALQWLLDKSINDTSHITVTGNNSNVASSRLVRKNLDVALLSDEANSFLSRFGGEFDFDNNVISYDLRLGSDKGYRIDYQKNLLGLLGSDSTENIVTRIMPQGFDGLLIPERYIISPREPEIGFAATKKIEFSDVVAEGTLHANENAVPIEEAYQMLRDKSNQLFEQGIDQPKVSIRIDFVELSKTEQYKDFAHLERVYIGDTVKCHYAPLDLEVEARVTAFTYNVLTGRYDQITVGTDENRLAKSISNVQTALNKIDEIQINLPSRLEKATTHATELLKSGWGGVVRYHEDEIFILDNENIEQAQNVWRFNINGLGFSSTGINGEYDLAMTRDGQIVADFITAGVMSSNILYGGMIKSNSGNTFINLDNDDFNFNHTFYKEGDYVFFASEDSDLKIRIGSGSIDFMSGDNRVAYIEGENLYITNGTFLRQVIIGNFGFIPRANGNLSLVKVG